MTAARRRPRARLRERIPGRAFGLAFAGALAIAAGAARAAVDLPPVSVVGVAPLPGLGVERDALPYTVQTGSSAELGDGGNGSLAEYLLRGLAGTNAADIQGSPFQRDITYRGYSASSLIGSPQGISVFLDGVRVNAPFGDVVNWDLVPEAALAKVMLVPGSNPIYGLNTLGGALVLTTQSGLTAPGFSADLRAGSFGRARADLAYGYHDDRGLHAFVAGTVFGEDGWRDHSRGRLGNLFAKVGRNDAGDELEAELLYGASKLVGNGLVPDTDYLASGARPSPLSADRAAVYTWPDETRNTLWQGSLRARHALAGDAVVDALAYVRYAKRHSVNGDASQDYEDYVDDCAAGFNADGSPVDGGCPLTREQGAALAPAVMNTTRSDEHSWGIAASYAREWRDHRYTLGADFNASRVSYSQNSQLATFTDDRGAVADADAPVAFVSGVDGASRAWGLWATDTWAVLAHTFVTGSLRFNASRVSNRLSTADDGTQPESTLSYRKLNPALGITRQLGNGLTLIANASQSTRVPTVIELGCADPSAPCRLPAGLQSDPPLEQVVARTLEVGLRWHAAEASAWLSAYRTDNRDDILFLRAANTQQGYFANFARTRNQGVDAAYQRVLGAVTLDVHYSYLDATYAADGALASGERTIVVHPGMRIAGLPRHTLKVTATWQVREHASLALDVIGVSSVGTAGNEDGAIADPAVGSNVAPIDARVAGYAVANLRGSYRFDRHFSVYGGVTNLFDTRYDTFGALATDLFASGALVAPQVAPGEAPVARFVAPGAPRAFFVGLGYRY